MISGLSRKILCNLIIGIAEGERKLEICRQVLCELKNFEPYTTFVRLDRQKQQYITALDLQNFFSSNNISINYSDAQLIIKNIDKDHDQKLIFEEFQDAILPKNSTGLKIQTQGRNSYYVAIDEYLEYDIEMALARLFQQIITNCSQYDSLKKQFRCQPDYDCRTAFQFLDSRGTGFIDYTSIDLFTKNIGRALSENEIIAFIQYADVDRDMRLNFVEFNEILIPGLPSPQQTSPIKSQLEQQQQQQSLLYTPLNQINEQLYTQTPTKQFMTPLKSNGKVCLEQDNEQYLIGLLKEMISMDKILQKLRNELSLQQDFNLLDAFRLFDLNEKKKVTKLQVEQTLNSIGIYPTKNELFLFFSNYDKDMDGYLSFGEFAFIFYTQDHAQINLINSRVPFYIQPSEGDTIQDIFCTQTRNILKKLFNQILENETILDNLKNQLSQLPRFNLQNAFNSLDKDQDGIISYEELKLILNSYNIFISDKEFSSLFQRFDKDKDGEIRFADFAKEINIKSPLKYSNQQ